MREALKLVEKRFVGSPWGDNLSRCSMPEPWMRLNG
jgi:hypothetical protein